MPFKQHPIRDNLTLFLHLGMIARPSFYFNPHPFAIYTSSYFDGKWPAVYVAKVVK